MNCIFVVSCFFSVSTTCSPFNVASQKYGGSCMGQSSSSSASTDCKYAVDGSSSVGWEPEPNGVVNSYLQIGFHTLFTVNMLRIQQNVTTGRQIQEILLKFSDCSHEKVGDDIIFYLHFCFICFNQLNPFPHVTKL